MKPRANTELAAKPETDPTILRLGFLPGGRIAEGRESGRKPGAHLPGALLPTSEAATQRGFTLREVILVLILVAMLSALALPRYSELNSDAIGDAETLKGTLRYIRTRAMSDIYSWQITVAGTTCTVQRNTAQPTSFSVTFATSGVASGTTTFDNRGQPSGTLSYDVSGYPNSPVTVTAGTGFVP
jgi:prepilin-type N-terminal cleavage/methylation domain-containing protein